MSSPVICVENLSKSYLIGHQGPRERYSSLRDTLANGAKSMLRKTRDLASGRQSLQGDSIEEFWALKDVSFEVQQGEVLGIIGRNGAGKSTLLKILSRITEPTSGRVTLTGRVASLLEVGTGFHPELTGRENLYLNGAILGMTRREITAKFDEIVDFAGVEKFLDTPVKRYSSGMYVRLAFAVAAHLEPEILIVDEVLAVGDAEFQKKCMGKMKDVAGGGRTVLFVSHNTAAISTLTESCVVLRNGELVLHGPTEVAIRQYLNTSDSSGSYKKPTGYTSHTPYIESIQIVTEREKHNTHLSGNSLRLRFKVNHNRPVIGACFSFQIVNQFQQPVIHCWIYDTEQPFCREGSSSIIECIIPKLSLNIGEYSLSCYLSEPPGGVVFEHLEGVCSFNVEIIDRQTLFGWRSEACCYHEDYSWNVTSLKSFDIL